MNIPDKIYSDFCKEWEGMKVPADMSAVIVVGELTRALKRVCHRYGGTAITIDSVKYDINGNVIKDE